MLRTIEDAGPSFGVETTSVLARDPAEIERVIDAFSREANGGLIVLTGPSTIAFRLNRPCLRAFWFSLGAPVSGAPPCMRQRRLPRSAGEQHDAPARIFAQRRRLVSIGAVLRA